MEKEKSQVKIREQTSNKMLDINSNVTITLNVNDLNTQIKTLLETDSD